MCQMYKREEGVNHEVAGVWLQIWFCRLFLFIVFVLYLYNRRAHKTREQMFHCCCGLCAAILQTHTHTHTKTQMRRDRHKRRQQGHVAHNKNTLDSRPQSNLFLLFLLPPLSNPFLLVPPFSANTLPPLRELSVAQLSLNHIFINFHTHSCALSLLFPTAPPLFFLPCLILPPLFLCFLCPLSCTLSLLSLLSCFLFALLLLWVSVLRCFFFFFPQKFFVLFCFVFWDSIYLYKWCKE